MSKGEQQLTVQRADPAARRVVLALLASLVLAALLAQRWLGPVSGPEVEPGPEAVRRLTSLLQAVLLVMLVSLAFIGGYCIRLGRRAAAQGRFPPAGVRVVKDTPVLTGHAARRRGVWLQGVGAIVFVLGGALALVGLRIVALLSTASSPP